MISWWIFIWGEISNGEVLVGNSSWRFSWSNLNGSDFKSWDKFIIGLIEKSFVICFVKKFCWHDEILFWWDIWICWELIVSMKFKLLILVVEFLSEFIINSSVLSVEWVFKWNEFGWLNVNLNDFI